MMYLHLIYCYVHRQKQTYSLLLQYSFSQWNYTHVLSNWLVSSRYWHKLWFSWSGILFIFPLLLQYISVSHSYHIYLSSSDTVLHSDSALFHLPGCYPRIHLWSPFCLFHLHIQDIFQQHCLRTYDYSILLPCLWLCAQSYFYLPNIFHAQEYVVSHNYQTSPRWDHAIHWESDLLLVVLNDLYNAQEFFKWLYNHKYERIALKHDPLLVG